MSLTKFHTRVGKDLVDNTTTKLNSNGQIEVIGGDDIKSDALSEGAPTWNNEGIIRGNTFRANQGPPNNYNSSTRGFAFGDDGDTGLFSDLTDSFIDSAPVSVFINGDKTAEFNTSNIKFLFKKAAVFADKEPIGSYNEARNFSTIINREDVAGGDYGGLFVGTVDNNGDEYALLCYNQSTDIEPDEGREGKLFSVNSNGNTKVYGDSFQVSNILRVGKNPEHPYEPTRATGGYIEFLGTYNDGQGTAGGHTYIGERLYNVTDDSPETSAKEASELFIYKGNDSHENHPEDSIDRIRLGAGEIILSTLTDIMGSTGDYSKSFEYVGSSELLEERIKVGKIGTLITPPNLNDEDDTSVKFTITNPLGLFHDGYNDNGTEAERNFNVIIDASDASGTDRGGLFIGSKDNNGDEYALLCYNQSTAVGPDGRKLFEVKNNGNTKVYGNLSATGNVSGPTPTEDSHLATKDYVDNYSAPSIPLDRGVLYVNSGATDRESEGKFDLGSPTLKVSDSNIVLNGDNITIPTGTWIVEVDGSIERTSNPNSNNFSVYLRHGSSNIVTVLDNFEYFSANDPFQIPIYCFFKIEVVDASDNISIWLGNNAPTSHKLSEGTVIKVTRYA